MKYLDIARLSDINSLLDSVDLGDSYVYSKLEAYSCKSTGADKKLFKTVSNSLETVNELSPSLNRNASIEIPLSSSYESDGFDVGSPFGPLEEKDSRKTFVSLISTLNEAYPDYDFSCVKATDFIKLDSAQAALNQIHTILTSSMQIKYLEVREMILSGIDEEIGFRECDVYSYIPGSDSDPFSEDGNLWGFNFFFYNRRLKRILFWSTRGISKAALQFEHQIPDWGEPLELDLDV